MNPRPTVSLMSAAVLAAPGRIELRDVPVPEPAAGQVRVRLRGCGVCASSLPVFAGRPWFTYPLEPGAPGHEGWGVVDAVGSGVTSVAEGAAVALLSEHAFAEYDLASAASVVALPPELADEPVPAEALGCAMNVFARSDVRAGQSVAVVGCGFLGVLLAELAAGAGARVVAISRRPYALRLAREAGAQRALVSDRDDIVAEVMEFTGGEGCDRVIEATGQQSGLDLAGKLTRVRGRLVIAGFHQDGLRQVDVQLWNWRGLDVVNAHERDPAIYRRGMEAAVAALLAGRLHPLPLYTEFPLAALDRAFAAAVERPDGFVKGLILV